MFSVYKVDRQWETYGYEERYLAFDGEETRWKVIMKDDKPIHIASKEYKLLPCEVAVEVSDLLSKELGAVKVGEWWNDERTRVYVLFDTGEEAEIIKGVLVRIGYFVYNSVDGTLAFGASVLTHFSKGNRTFYGMVPTTRLTAYLSPTTAAAIYRHVHRKGLETEKRKLLAKLANLAERGKESIAIFRLWSDIQLDEQLAGILAHKIPKVYLPPYIKVLKEGVTLLELVSVWDTYVDICARVWESEKAGIDRKYALYQALHSVLPIKK